MTPYQLELLENIRRQCNACEEHVLKYAKDEKLGRVLDSLNNIRSHVAAMDQSTDRRSH
jgi:hypothetical protein